MQICLMPTMGISLPADPTSCLPFGKAEADRLLAIRHPRHAQESYAALLALKQLVGDLPRCILRTKEGKPYFADSPDTSFSMAHHSGLAAAVCTDMPVGIDLELLRPHTAARSIAERFFTSAEQQRVAAYGNDASAFFRVWTEKEALGKLLGTGFLYKDSEAPHLPHYQTYEICTDGRCYLLTLCTLQKGSVTHWLIPTKEEVTYERLS